MVVLLLLLKVVAVVVVMAAVVDGYTDPAPILVLHVGPSKTATSTIQSKLGHYRQKLYEDASVAYMGRIYDRHLRSSHKKAFLKPQSSINVGPKFDTRKLIKVCFPQGEKCKEQKIWELLEEQVAYFAHHNKSVILSDEAFTDGLFISQMGSDNNRGMMYELFRKYYPGRVHVALVHRRHYERSLSRFNAHNTPHKHGDGAYTYKEEYMLWPSEGGETVGTILREFSRLFEATRTTPQYLRLWGNHSSEVVVLNFHEMQGSSNREDDFTTHFLRGLFPPLVGDALSRMKDSKFVSRPNLSKNVDYDRLAVAAYEKGLLVNQHIPRSEVARLTEEHLLKNLATTKDRLPRRCLNETELQHFLMISLALESEVYPNLSKESARQHESDYREAAQQKKFCDLDTGKLLEDHAVQEFFTVFIPKVIKQGNDL